MVGGGRRANQALEEHGTTTASHFTFCHHPADMSLTTTITTGEKTSDDAHLYEKETDADMEGLPMVPIQDEADKMEAGSTQLVGDDEEIVVARPLPTASLETPRARKIPYKAPRKVIPREVEGGEESSDGEESSKEKSDKLENNDEDESSSAVEAEVVQHGDEDDEDVDVNDDEPVSKSLPNQQSRALTPSPGTLPQPHHRSRTPSPINMSSSSAFSFASSLPPSSSTLYPAHDAESSMVPSRTEGLLVQMMQQNTMIMMKQQEQNEKFMMFLQQQAVQTQTNFQMLSQKVDNVSTRILQQEREITDLKRGVSFRAEDMEQGLDIISRKPNLRRVFEFIARYGMDTRTGYVVAFPVLIAGKLCVAVSLQLLSYAMAAMFPINMKPQKDFTLAGLKALMNSVSTETVGHRTVLNFTSLFGVDSYSGTEGRQASNNLSVWRVYQATTFLKAVRSSLNYAGDSGLGILEPEIEASAVTWTRTSRIMWSQASMLDKNACRRMAWAQTVQEEVLREPAVKQFFQLVPSIMGPSSPSRSSAGASREVSREALPFDEPFHFCGVEPLFEFPVKNHAQLVRERRVALQREREAMEDKLKDDRIESQVVNGRNLRKRGASTSAAPRGKVPKVSHRASASGSRGSSGSKTVGEIAKSRGPATRGGAASGSTRRAAVSGGHGVGAASVGAASVGAAGVGGSARTAGVSKGGDSSSSSSSASSASSDSSSDSESSRSSSSHSDSDDEVVRAPSAAPRGVKK